MQRITVSTDQAKQVIDLTDRIQKEIPDGFSGICHLSVQHTTTALSTADLDPGTDLDMLDAFEKMIPAHAVGEARSSSAGRPKLQYRHPHNPAHVPDHILSTLIGTAVAVPVQEGKLILGTWQRIVLFEFDGPQERSFTLVLTAETA